MMEFYQTTSICFVWILAFVLWMRIEPPVVDTGLPVKELKPLYDSKLQLSRACRDYIRANTGNSKCLVLIANLSKRAKVK